VTLPRTSSSRGELLVLLIALVLPTAVTWVYFVALDGAPAALQQTAYGVGKAIQFGLPVVWVFGVCRERQSVRRPPIWSLAAGAVLGLVIAVGMAALYFTIRRNTSLFDAPAVAVQAKVASFGVRSPAAFALLAVFYSAVHSLLEEYYWRWFAFGRLRAAAGLPAAIAISGVAFASHHVLVLALYFGWMSPFTWAFSLCVAVGGAIWAWLYHASDSLAATWLSHALVDAAIFAIGYQMIDWSRL
jgi:membrane protease YdiL (CAAX protease family)